MLLLLLSGDIKLCPGPCVKCPTCSKSIRKNQRKEKCLHCGNDVDLKCLVDKIAYGYEQMWCRSCIVKEALEGEPVTRGNESIYQHLADFLKPQGLKLFHQNVNGLVNKLENVNILLMETKRNIDILGITETHLHENIKVEEVEVGGYSFVGNDRETGHNGGVVCYIWDGIHCQRRKDLEKDIEAIWIEIFVQKSKSILVCFVYKPPVSSKYLDPDFLAKFDDMLSMGFWESKETILLGDLNADFLRKAKDKEVKRVIRENGLEQIIKEPIRVTKDTETLIDIIAISHEQNVLTSIVYGNSASDHDLIGVIMKKNNRKCILRVIYKRNYAKYNVDNFKQDLQNQPWTKATREDNVHNGWKTFKSLLKTVIDKHAPVEKKKIRGHDCPWLTSEIHKKINERDFFLRKVRKTGKENDWSMYCRLRTSVTHSIRHGKATYTRSILQENIDRPKQFWDKIKRCFPTKSINRQNNKVFEVNGKQTSDLKATSNGFCIFFATIGKALQKPIPSLRDNIWKHHDYATMKQTMNRKRCCFHFKPTNRNEVWAILRKIKRKKAPGHDDIPTCMLIDGADEISAPLSEMINHCLDTSVFPSDEKIAKVLISLVKDL